MTKSLDEKLLKELSTHESRMKSRDQYRGYAKTHMIMAIIMGVAFIITQGAQLTQVTPLMVFLTVINFLIAYKHIGTCQLITAVDFIERSKTNLSNEN